MNLHLIFSLVGTVLQYEVFFLLIPLIVSIGGPDTLSFVYTILLTAVISFAFRKFKPEAKKYRNRDGFAAVALAWLLCSFFGALPYYFSGYFPGFIDCFFESVSGFTTTGATILREVESLPRGILLWRSLTHWFGGMGVLVFAMAVMPSAGASSVNLLRAESTGPVPSKIVPKIKDTARILYTIYFVMTLVQFVLLMIAGLSWFDAAIHTLGSAGTGGFSSRNLSVGAFNNVPAEVIITVFMFLFGVNFTLYSYFLRGVKTAAKNIWKDEEFLLYVAVVSVSILVITADITKMYGSVFTALRHSSFQVSTIITTTGYATTDFNLWPTLSRLILVFLMLTGCSAGSTGGGIKLIRILILVKSMKTELFRIVHPRVVNPLKINGKKLENEDSYKAAIFFFIYLTLIILGSFLISLENTDMVTAVTSVISCISNIGPGLEMVGPMGNFAFFSGPSKALLSLLMLAGRLELYPMLILLSPSFWRETKLG